MPPAAEAIMFLISLVLLQCYHPDRNAFPELVRQRKRPLLEQRLGCFLRVKWAWQPGANTREAEGASANGAPPAYTSFSPMSFIKSALDALGPGEPISGVVGSLVCLQWYIKV